MSINPDPVSVYEEITPGEPLKKIVERLWRFSCSLVNSEEASFFLLPDYSFSLVFIRGVKSGITEFFLVSPMLKKIKFTFDEDIIIAGALFKPMVLNSMYKLSESVYTEIVINAEKFFQDDFPSGINEKLKNSVNTDEILKVLQEFFTELKDKYKEPEKILAEIIRDIINSEGKLKLEDIYKKYSINSRQFQRKFRLKTGLKPKEFIRIVRLSKAATKLVKEGYHHFDVLTGAGYYDQSHYCKEFKSLYGDNPTHFETAQKRIKHVNLID